MNVKSIFKKHLLSPKKYLGQNFLISNPVLHRIIEAAELQPQDIVLEIGPGIGALTGALAKRVKKVIAVEKDAGMIEILKETLKDFRNIKIIHGDVLEIKNLKLKIKNYKIVANLPYYITAPCIRMFLEAKHPPAIMVLLVQKEVGQRICASPLQMSKLAVFTQFYAKPKIINTVSKKAFWPQPKVDGVILRIVPRIDTDRNTDKRGFVKRFAKIVKAGFSQPRKQLVNNFQKQLNLSREEIENWLQQNNIKPNQRAETLSLEDWVNLTKTF